MTVKEILDKADFLIKEAEYDEDTYNLFDCNYKWELSEDIYNILKRDSEVWRAVRAKPDDYRFESTFMGYPIVVNLETKEMIKLWREVE